MSHSDPGHRTSQPYAVPIASSAIPEDVVAQLATADRPGVLWGSWFGGGVLMFQGPLRTVAVAAAKSAFAHLDELPVVSAEWSRGGLVGGGWLTCLGYTDGNSSLAFYDSLLRWQPHRGWSYESLGLSGRADADRTALAEWRTRLAAPAGGGHREAATFSTAKPPGSARDAYLAAVEAAIGRIHRGDFYQMNLCTRLHAECSGPPVALFARLAATLEPAYGAFLTVGGGGGGPPGAVASLSPELFLRVRGETVLTSPIKGTAPRRPGEDTSSALRSSAKETAENIMIVDLMRNDLSRVCRPGTVAVSDLLSVQPHPGVWHLVSTVRGQLSPGVSIAGLLEATFPPGSVTGAPKSSAERGIADLEPELRGAYTGSIGLVSPLAGADFNVVIRTFESAGDRWELGVGGGLTADSVPIREWYECLHKAQPLVEAAGGRLDPRLGGEPVSDPALVAGGVFESILVSGGRVIRLDRHLARLDTSCRELYGLGLPSDLAESVRAAVARAATGDRAAIRVTAMPDRRDEPPGLATVTLETVIEVRPLGPRLAACRIRHRDRPDRGWRHKWSDRAWSAEAEAAVAPELPYFTSIGRPSRLSETSRGNLFLLGPDGAWRTPPLDETVLPGVTRREVLDLFDERGQPVRIEQCTPADLQNAGGAFWTSSLSGAVAVNAVDGHPLPSDRRLLIELNRALGHAQ